MCDVCEWFKYINITYGVVDVIMLYVMRSIDGLMLGSLHTYW